MEQIVDEIFPKVLPEQPGQPDNQCVRGGLPGPELQLTAVVPIRVKKTVINRRVLVHTLRYWVHINGGNEHQLFWPNGPDVFFCLLNDRHIPLRDVVG